MKTKEEVLREAYSDIMYSTKTPKEVADFEKKKKALQNQGMYRKPNLK